MATTSMTTVLNYRGGCFVLKGALAIMLTLLTESYQSIKADMVNPVKSLRSE